MRLNPSPRFTAALALAFAALTLGGPSARSDDRDGEVKFNEIRFDILGLRNDHGVVTCLLFNSADGYPADATKAVARFKSIIEHGRAACTFDDPRAGTYALAFIHDENENGKLDTNFLGIPAEGIGASNDAHGPLGRAGWDEAKFEHQSGLQSLQLHAKYF